MKQLFKILENILFLSVISLLLVGRSNEAMAFKDKTFALGAGYYSQNFLNRTSNKTNGSTGILGEANFPLNFMYQAHLATDWYVAPQLSYTLFPRSTPGNTAKVTITHLVFQFGKNFGGIVSTPWDWYIGPGYMEIQYKGAGGTTVMNNGTGTAVFALPGSTATTKKVTSNFGVAYNIGSSRVGLDVVIENLASAKKRTESFMLSYAYQFGGGLY